MFIFLGILVQSYEGTKLPQDKQGCCKTCSVLTAIVLAHTHIFLPLMPKECRVITMLLTMLLPMKFACLTKGCTCKSYKSASPSCDSPEQECKTIMQASYGCFTFIENPHMVCNFFCNMPHGMLPAENCTANFKQLYN